MGYYHDCLQNSLGVQRALGYALVPLHAEGHFDWAYSRHNPSQRGLGDHLAGVHAEGHFDWAHSHNPSQRGLGDHCILVPTNFMAILDCRLRCS